MAGAHTKFKTPISYYGGKQQLAPKIIKWIPEHTMYIEPFCGGAAVFFEKEKEKFEVINDTNSELINLYRIMQTQFNELQTEIKASLHSRQLYFDAIDIYNNPTKHSDVKRAWATWYGLRNAFNNEIGRGFKTNKSANMNQSHAVLFENAKSKFDERIMKRLEGVTIECKDALEIIKEYDNENHFFYIDPPYIGTVMGHYKGYNETDFEELLKVLSEIKGKFLLSSFQSNTLEDYTITCNWFTHVHSMKQSSGYGAAKQEIFTSNYEIKNN